MTIKWDRGGGVLTFTLDAYGHTAHFELALTTA